MWKLKIAEGAGPWLSTVNNHIGRQHWEFDSEAGTPEERSEIERVRLEFRNNRFQIKQSSDLLMRMQLTKENPSLLSIPPQVKVEDTEDVTEEAVTTTLRRAINFYSTIQAHDGHWPAESAGPLFFLPPLVMVLYIIGSLNVVLSSEHQKEIIRYMYNHQNEDGGWGFHIEGHSTMFGSVLNYIALRLLGEGPDDGEDMAMAKGREWILDHGGATAIPSWGKFWITVLGVYEWEGCNPMPPEFWLLPDFFPVHPEIVGDKLGKEHLYDAVNVILSLQSNNGGFSAWEPARAYRWLEFQKFNPMEFFEDTLIEHEYVECTSSAVHALALFKKLYPEYRKKEIKNCIVRAIRYIEDAQNPDGSWYGCWGICFTYGTWFAVEGLVACGWNYHNSPSIHKTCEFLLSKQLPRGGWGELSFKSKQGRCIQI